MTWQQQEQPARVWEPEVLSNLGECLGSADDTTIDQVVLVYLIQGRQLVDRLRDATETSDAVTLRAVAHSLRGSTLTVGGARLAAICQQIELTQPAARAQVAARAVPQEFEALADQLAGRAGAELSSTSKGRLR